MDCGELYVYPHTWVLQHIAPGMDKPAPQSSDLGQMLTCRRMEWQKCTSLLKAWGGGTQHTICFAIHLVQNVIKPEPYRQCRSCSLSYTLNLAAGKAGLGWRVRLNLPQHRSVSTWLDYVVCVRGRCPSEQWCDCIKYVLGSIRQAGCFIWDSSLLRALVHASAFHGLR